MKNWLKFGWLRFTIVADFVRNLLSDQSAIEIKKFIALVVIFNISYDLTWAILHKVEISGNNLILAQWLGTAAFSLLGAETYKEIKKYNNTPN
jgi:hypothetical protein